MLDLVVNLLVIQIMSRNLLDNYLINGYFFSLELSVLKILSTVMDPRSEFNFRNRSKRSKHNSSHVSHFLTKNLW